MNSVVSTYQSPPYYQNVPNRPRAPALSAAQASALSKCSFDTAMQHAYDKIQESAQIGRLAVDFYDEELPATVRRALTAQGYAVVRNYRWQVSWPEPDLATVPAKSISKKPFASPPRPTKPTQKSLSMLTLWRRLAARGAS